MICKAARLLALEYAPLAALVPAAKFKPEGEGQGQPLPRITYLLVDDVPVTSHSGSSGLSVARIQMNVMADDEGEVAMIAERLRLALVGRKTYSGGMRIDSVFLIGNHGGYDPDPTVYKRIMDFRITHSEAVE